MITILAHRGFWKIKEEQNSAIAFERAFNNGFGVETDIRDICGKIVISHDMPKGNEITLEDLLEIMNEKNLPLALNIKADGLGDSIYKILKKYNHSNYFTFDMSIPDMIAQSKTGLKIFTGISDIIEKPIMYCESLGIWLDSFNSDWFSENDIRNLLRDRKEVCIVSPELHGRDYKSVWKKYKNLKEIMLCTDYPQEARKYFNE